MNPIDQAIELHQRGQLAEAETIYRRVLASDAHNFDALHMLGIIHAQRAEFEKAEGVLRAAVSADPTVPQCLHNYGNVLSRLGQYQAAIEAYDKAIKLVPNHPGFYSDRGNAQKELGRPEEALLSYDKALSLNPSFSAAHYNRAIALFQLKRYAESLESYDRSIALVPNYPEAWNNRGSVLFELKRYEEALSASDRALALKPDLVEGWIGRGNALQKLDRQPEALSAYDKAIALKSDAAEAWLARGNILYDQKRHDDALFAYDKASTLKPELAQAWHGRGNVLQEVGRYGEAFAAYEKAFALNPDVTYTEGARLHVKLRLCNWSNLEAEVSHLVAGVRERKSVSDPFPFVSISSSAADQLQCANLWIADKPSFAPIWRGEVFSHDRIRVAYLSADFHEHATAYLTAGLFEHHDRSRFEFTAVSFGPEQDSAMRRRLKGSFERFVDAHLLSDLEIAQLLRRLEIDIAVDLKGFTQHARPGILARRPTPIQVNYLGYPGTMGFDHIDYIIADPVVIPADQFEHYGEKVVWLPDSYQVNDRKRQISERVPTRSECGLPNVGFVFCCFNNLYKIMPDMFRVWMALLKVNAGSVLWLLEGGSTAATNLRTEAEKFGVAESRLVFAPKMGLADHLARFRQADLFLDTLPYNAHTTASDALWAGLPVVTCLGTTFAGRVAASLLKAAGLPDLVTSSLEDYKSLALSLAQDRLRLAVLKDKLARQRETCTLFNTERFAHHIEAAYTKMWERYQREEAPEPFAVDPID